ncbi:hypothetical protein [Aurantiacibacter poecillastricola]|uniref:hypothetical protein n=1 Tax=Aurantiacibacter poecillastricola TaxID=3064385 RepID=UPI00273FF454|nr:hypothetical protein [Aurantiacibacter sp. 219JJ12-13]MDP5263141.1 hypothetical protein [Aurantiacibacter sp. 219JJ12-13]
MVSCQVSVVRGKGSDSEDWGPYDFVSVPSHGDRVMVTREGTENYVTVLSVHHYPTAHGQGGAPVAEVVGKWTGSGQKLR